MELSPNFGIIQQLQVLESYINLNDVLSFKRVGTMKLLNILLILGLVLLVSNVFAQNAAAAGTDTTDDTADTNTDIEIPESVCVVDEDCASDINAEDSCSAGECYCSLETNTCFIRGSAEDKTADDKVPAADKELTGTEETTKADSTVALVEEKLKLLQEQSASVEDKLNNLEQVVQLLQQQITLLGEKLDLVSSQQTQSKEVIQKDVTGVATGLAGLQEDIGTAQKNLKTVEEDVAKIQTFKLIVTIAGLILISAGILLGLQYYLKAKKTDPRLLQYVVKQLRQGQRYPQIHQALQRAGWGNEDIKNAFQEAARMTSQRATAGPSGGTGPAGMDSKKVMLLAGFALFFIIGIILVLNGVTTGRAIYFKDAGELSAAVKENIEKNLEKNEFYSLAKQFDLCVQVEEEDNVASYRVTKTKKGDTIKEAALHCDNTNKFGFAVKFKSWEAFDLVSNSLTCSNVKTLHNKNQMYVLPSKFIEAGFKVDPAMDFSPYCSVLSKCLTAKQIQDAGIEC